MDTKNSPIKVLSTTSSFEAINIDPNLSKLANQMFEKTEKYLTTELKSNLEDYKLLQTLNNASSGKYQEIKQTVDTVVIENSDLNTKYDQLEPLMEQLKVIEATVNKLETAAYRLDNYTVRLEEKINLHIQKIQNS